MNFEDILIKRAFIIAKQAVPYTKTNPLVASLIYNNNNTILSEGIHERFGENHAEVNAFSSYDMSSDPDDRELSLFVTLEPCNHYGKTPPCVNLIMNKKIKEVLIGKLDPNPLMSGKSLNILNQNGISAKVIEQNEDMSTLLKHFEVNIEKKRPYILLKMATDKNGVAGDKNKRLYITESTSQFFAHKMRASVNAILIGTHTALEDNPELTNRLAGGEHPLRIVFDKKGILPKELNLFSDGHPTLYLSTIFRDDLSDTDQKIFTEQDFNNLNPILNYLYAELNIGTLLVEGGPGLVSYFINQNYWDEFYHFISPKIQSPEQPVYFHFEKYPPVSKLKLKNDDLYIYRNI